MRVASKLGLGILICSQLLVSCGGVTPVPMATTTAVATNTFIATSSSEPSLTATYSPAEKIFTLPTQEFRLIDTPTPIATPNFDNSSVNLKEMSESDLLNLIDWMNQYSYQNFPSLGDWRTDGQFIGSQQLVALAIQEYLYRFPNSSEAKRLKWQLTFINSIHYSGLPGNQYGDDWMLKELQDRLDHGETSPDHLENILGRYWFDVVYSRPVENLFRDDKVGWIYQVAPRVWMQQDPVEISHEVSRSIGSLFFAVRDVGDEKFKIQLLRSAWNFLGGESSVFSIDDHNQNGTPEIALYIGAHGGLMCGGNLLIYEWQIDSFDELTNSHISRGNCGEDIEYSTVDGAPAIVHSEIFPKLTENYVWDGKAYKFLRYSDMTPFEIWQYSLGSSSSYADEAEILKEMLTSGEATKYGTAYIDFLRYRLGVAYAFQSQRDKAFSEFQYLVSNPLDKTRNIFPNMAKKFMDVYIGDESIYDACHQSYKVYDKALAPSRDVNGYVDDKKRQELLGIIFDDLPVYYIVFPCDERKAFELMVNSMPTTLKDLNTELRRNGVDINYSRKLDVNLDETVEEWVVVFDTTNLFLIYPNGSYYQAKELSASIEISNTSASTFQIAIDRWSNFPNPVMIIQSNQDFTLLDVGDNFEIKRLFYEFHVVNYVISNQDTIPQLQLFYAKPQQNAYYPDHPWDGYRWDPIQHAFRDDLLEYNLFVLHDPEKSLEMVDSVFPLLKEWRNIPEASTWSLPYTYYISGLSYELSGNGQKAAQVYWQLWHDYPESPYALMARYKLEPVKP